MRKIGTESKYQYTDVTIYEANHDPSHKPPNLFQNKLYQWQDCTNVSMIHVVVAVVAGGGGKE